MGIFDHLQRKPSSTSSTPAAPTTSFLRPSRPFAPLPTPASQHVTPVTQTQLDRPARLGHSLERIPLFSPERKNARGLPDTLQAGVESLSGMAMDDVKVHDNSTPPSHLQMQHSSSPALSRDVANPTSLPASSTTRVYGGHDFSRMSVHDNDKRGSRSSHASSESLGNNYQVIHQRIPFLVTIQRVDSGPSPKKRLDNQQLFHPTSVPTAHLDAGPGKESKVGGPLPEAMRYQSRTNIPEPEEGQTVHLPDITYPSLAKISQTDAPLSSHLTYNGTIAQKFDEPKEEFGLTWPYDYTLTDRLVRLTDTHWEVHATLNNPIWFHVRKTTGPDGQINISSPLSSNITSGDYEAIAADLTPNEHDLRGRPPRNKYWAKDITILHEKFHAEENKKFAADATHQVVGKMNELTASSQADVEEIIEAVPNGVGDHVAMWMEEPAREERAYGAGKHLYEDRVKAIRRKGKQGGYPKK